MAFLVEISHRRQALKNRLGKTALQKLVYLLQEAYGIRLGYRFELYTYGPFDAALMGDMDYANAADWLNVEYDQEEGYQITPGTDAADLAEFCEQIRSEAQEELGSLFENFGPMNARDLELRATLVSVVIDSPEMEDGDVFSRMKELKPKYATKDIYIAFDELKQTSILDHLRAVPN